MANPFKERCETDPQGVIKDLLSQSRNQAKAIHEKSGKIKELEDEITLILTVLKKVASDDVIEKFETELKKKKAKKR